MQPFSRNGDIPLSEKRHFPDQDPMQRGRLNHSLGSLPPYVQDATKFVYGKALEQQAQDRQTQNKQFRQQELEQDKRLLQENINNDPFGRDRINYERAHARSVMNAKRGFVGVGNQIINQKPVFSNNNAPTQDYMQPQTQHQEFNPAQQQYAAYFEDMNQIKKRNQQEELKRAYQQQIAEREQRRVDELRRKIQEEREEEERRKNKQGMEQQWMNEEYNRKLAQELLARQLLLEREMAERRKYGTRGTHRPPTPPIEIPMEPHPQVVEEEVAMPDPVDEEAEKERRMNEMKAELYEQMTNQVQNVLDQEMGKLKIQMDVQNKILRDQVLTLKSQALFAEELRQDSLVELKRLHKDIEGGKVFEDIREKNLSKYLKDVKYLYKNTQPISDNGNFAFSFPERKIQPLFENKTRPINNDRELAGEINYLPVREPTIGFRENLNKGKYQNLQPRSSHGPSNNYTMRRIDPNLPDYIDLNIRNPYYQEAKSDQIWAGDEFGGHSNMNLLDKNERRLEGLNELYKDDEIEKLDSMLRDSILGVPSHKNNFY